MQKLKAYLKKEHNILSPKEIINIKHIELPVISKPNWGGSSKGIKFLTNKDELKRNINNRKNLIEEIIHGKELTVTVIENKNKSSTIDIIQ